MRAWPVGVSVAVEALMSKCAKRRWLEKRIIIVKYCDIGATCDATASAFDDQSDIIE